MSPKSKKGSGLGRRLVSLLTMLSATTWGSWAAGEWGPKRAAAEEGVRSSEQAQIEQAQDRFRRGVDLYNEGDFSGALVELTRAYELAPHFRILFNLGQLCYERRDYAAALDYLTRYLGDGGDQVPAPRRLQVENDLAELRLLVGHIGIRASEPASTVIVDDIERGSTPLPASLAANVGRHRVEVVGRDGQRQSRVIDLSAGQTLWLTFGRSVPRLDGRTAAAATALAERKPVHHPQAQAQPDEGDGATARLMASSGREQPAQAERRWAPWVAWAMTAACAGSAAVTGALAWRTSFELQRKIDSYPVSQRELDGLRSDQHRLALATDGLLLGAAVLSVVSLYLSFSTPSKTKSAHSSVGAIHF